MKAVISTTYEPNYLFFLPLTTFLWNKLGCDVICFMPLNFKEEDKRILVTSTIAGQNLKITYYYYTCPEHKEATYAQCARLFAASKQMSDDEILITGDIDMGMFKLPPYVGGFTVFGADLVPTAQYPMCYISAKNKDWEAAFSKVRTYQECLDSLVGAIECEHFRGNQWSLDQGEAKRRIDDFGEVNLIPRARPGTQFANNRVDRDDINWRHYVNENLVDAHFWRPGFQESNFKNILELLEMMYPMDNFDWLIQYKNSYVNL